MKCELLSIYFGKRNSASTKLHSHDYWQLEIVTQGVIPGKLLGEAIDLETGDMLLVPPGWEHGFWYNEPVVSWITLKFERLPDDFPVWGGLIRSNQFTNRLLASFRAAIHDTACQEYEKVFIHGFLETMFYYVRSEQFHLTSDPDKQLVKQITDRIMSRAGRAITINELADQLSYTRSHLSKKFKEMTGESLKSYIDRIRIQKIEEQLRYREISITEIASDLGFGDLFSFSRFFKKHTGQSPRQYVKNASTSAY